MFYLITLQTVGHLKLIGQFFDEKISDVYTINIIIGALSSIVNNVPLVAGTMGMYDIVSPDEIGIYEEFHHKRRFLQVAYFLL